MKFLIWIISSTNLIRNLVLSLVGAMVAAGIINDSNVNEVAAGLTILTTSLLNYLVEHAKTVNVKDIQQSLRTDGIPLKVDGYLGPVTRRAIQRKLTE